jgi:16S rRNA C967 or C1407 C5-methylase (RsmB/RsmF family)
LQISAFSLFLCFNISYNPELVEMFMAQFSPTETLEFFEANEQPRPMVIRANTLKTRRRVRQTSNMYFSITSFRFCFVVHILLYLILAAQTN